jgi:hypothetical protein
MSSQNCLNSIHLKSIKLVSFPDAQTLTSMSIYVDIPSYAHLHSHPSVRILPSHPSVRPPSIRPNPRFNLTRTKAIIVNIKYSNRSTLTLSNIYHKIVLDTITFRQSN